MTADESETPRQKGRRVGHSRARESARRELRRELKERIGQAARSVNRELVWLYWQIGRDILARQRQQGWGAKVIDRPSLVQYGEREPLVYPQVFEARDA